MRFDAFNHALLALILELKLDGLERLARHRNFRDISFLLEDVCDALLILECVISTAGSNARCALRIRVNMSEIGSIIKLQLAFVIPGINPFNAASRIVNVSNRTSANTAAAAAERTAIDHAGRACVARQLRQPGVVAFRFQFSPDGGVFLHRLLFALVALFP